MLVCNVFPLSRIFLERRRIRIGGHDGVAAKASGINYRGARQIVEPVYGMTVRDPYGECPVWRARLATATVGPNGWVRNSTVIAGSADWAIALSADGL